MYKLKIISSSVREGRKGPIVLKWIEEQAKQDERFQVEVIDLKEINLPMMNEPHHPAQKKYEFDYTKKWSATIEDADAFIFVTAEYDYGYPAVLRNALEYLFHEWTFKAAGIVSYGGVSAGTRAFNSLKGDLATFKVPVAASLHLPFFNQLIKDDVLQVNESMEKSLTVLLNELARWTKGMLIIKENK